MAESKYQLYKDKAGKFRYRLFAKNQQVILTGEGYSTKAAAKNGINSVKKNGEKKERFSINQARNKKFYFNLVSGNNEIIGSSQMYASKDTLRNGIASVMRNAKSPIEEV